MTMALVALGAFVAGVAVTVFVVWLLFMAVDGLCG